MEEDNQVYQVYLNGQIYTEVYSIDEAESVAQAIAEQGEVIIEPA